MKKIFFNKNVVFLLFYLITSLLPFDFAFGENKMPPEKNTQPAWELSNTDSLQKAGAVKATGTALLVIDYQNFNANKKRFLGHLFDDKNNAISKTKIVIEKARKAGIPIIYLNTILNPKLMPNTTLFTMLKKNIPWDKLTP